MSKVSYIASGDRIYITSRILSLIKTDIVSRIKNCQRVLIKPFIYSSDDQLRSTHADALEALLEFISPHVSTQITIAAGTEQGDTLDAFNRLNYFKLQDIYDFAIVDLNNEKYVDYKLQSRSVLLPEAYLNSDYIISLTPPILAKDNFFACSIANIIERILFPGHIKSNKLLGKLSFSRKSDKSYDLRLFEENFISSVLDKLHLALSIIDAYSFSSAVNHGSKLSNPHWACASTDFIANDYFAMGQLGQNNAENDYLSRLIELLNQEAIVVGDSWQQHRAEFQ